MRVGNGTEIDGGDRRVPLGSWSLGMSQFSSVQSLRGALRVLELRDVSVQFSSVA